MKTFYREFATLMNFLYWLPMFISVAVAIVLSTVVIWWGGNYFKIKKIYKIIANIIAVALAVFIVPLHWTVPVKKEEQKAIAEYNERKAKYEAAKAVFDEQCKKAGEKIYRTVDNVDGVMLLKVREKYVSQQNNPLFEDVFSVIENGYINGFLSPLTAEKAVGYYPPVNEKGYAFVEVLEDTGDITRYVDYIGSGDNDKYKYTTTKNPANPARYAVTYENNVDPELRKHWVAGTTIKIIDRQTDELLAEKTIFAFARTMGTYSHGAWVYNRMDFCPEVAQQRITKNFVVTVLKP